MAGSPQAGQILSYRLGALLNQPALHALFGMKDDDHYRAKAEEAKREADRTTNELDRPAWLRMAQGWLALIKKRAHHDDTEG